MLDTFMRGFDIKTLVLGRNGVGLGNRLKHMASFHVYHGLNDTHIFWASRGWVSAPFRDLFNIEFIPGLKIYDVCIDRLAGYSFPSLGNNDFWRLKIEPDEVGEEFLIERRGQRFKAVDFCYNTTPQHIKEKYLSFFGLLRPSSAVQRRLDSIQVNDDTVCIHVRNPVSKLDPANSSSINWYIEHMRSYPESTRFFISTMGPTYSEVFHETFGKRIIELPNKQYDSMVDAVADLFLLSSGKVLVATAGSTFPEIAWWLGGCEQLVVSAPIRT